VHDEPSTPDVHWPELLPPLSAQRVDSQSSFSPHSAPSSPLVQVPSS
jgi:hypothetical protein